MSSPFEPLVVLRCDTLKQSPKDFQESVFGKPLGVRCIRKVTFCLLNDFRLENLEIRRSMPSQDREGYVCPCS